MPFTLQNLYSEILRKTDHTSDTKPSDKQLSKTMVA